jgi:hypothetical protein
MSLYADYAKARKGHEVLETEVAFLEYSIREPFLRIEELYVMPYCQNEGHAADLIKSVTLIAKEKNLTHLWARVVAFDKSANRTLSVAIKTGWVVQSAQNDCIILTKEVGG